MNTILFGLFAETVRQFADFARLYFKCELTDPDDLGVLPVGFGRPVTPTDFLSAHSASANAPREVKAFLKYLHDAGERLYDAGVAPEHSLLVSFRVAVESVKNAKNADTTTAIDNNRPADTALKIVKKTVVPAFRLTNDSQAPVFQAQVADITAQFCLNYKNVQAHLRTALSGVKLNDRFLNLMKQLELDPTYCHKWPHDPANPTGAGKKKYSDLILQALIDGLTPKNDPLNSAYHTRD